MSTLQDVLQLQLILFLLMLAGLVLTRRGVITPAGRKCLTDLLIDLNVSYQALRNANPTLRPGFLVAGTFFCAPPAGSRTACVGNRTYVVQDGDNLNSIARRLGTTNGRMLMLNPTLLPTDFSQAGTTICIP